MQELRQILGGKSVDRNSDSFDLPAELNKQVDPIDRTHIHRVAESIAAGRLELKEGRDNVREMTQARVKERVIAPAQKALKAKAQKASELLPIKKDHRKAFKKQLSKVPPKIIRTSKEAPREKTPLGWIEISRCSLFTIFSIGILAWGIVNTRNMAINSFPVFAESPELAWGVGGVIALLSLFLEMVPDFFGFKGVARKIYHGTVGAITGVAGAIWVGLFAKSAGFLGHGGGISVDLESMLAPEGTFLGLTPNQQDLLLTGSNFTLEFLLPAILLAYVFQTIKSHGLIPPPVLVEENPDYQKLVREIEILSVEIGDLKRQIKELVRFERIVDDIVKQYVLRADSNLLECCGQI